jgi:hypothetical protein
MTPKPKKTTAELTALLMTEIRKHPECNHVTSVGITRPMQSAPHHPNWAPAWSFNSPKIEPPIAVEIAGKFQNEFDLI